MKNKYTIFASASSFVGNDSSASNLNQARSLMWESLNAAIDSPNALHASAYIIRNSDKTYIAGYKWDHDSQFTHHRMRHGNGRYGRVSQNMLDVATENYRIESMKYYALVLNTDGSEKVYEVEYSDTQGNTVYLEHGQMSKVYYAYDGDLDAEFSELDGAEWDNWDGEGEAFWYEDEVLEAKKIKALTKHGILC